MNMRRVWPLVAVAALGFGTVLPALGEATAPATTSTTTKAKVREADDVLGDLKTTSGEIRDILDSPKSLMDEAKRTELAPKLIPLLSRMMVLMNELGEAQPEVKSQIQGQRFQMLAMLSLLGDAVTKKSLDEAAAKTVDEKADNAKELKDEVLQAKLAKHLSAWWAASKDAPAQEKILADMSAIAKAAPKNEQVAATLMMMSNMGPASKAMATKAEAVVMDMSGRIASAVKTQKESDAKKAEGVGKPIVLAGKTVGGKDFSSTEYKGKVVLVDFWATWCGPCLAELPRVQGIYKKYHEKGLEIVGISCDSDGAALAAFTKEKGMPWVQLWDKDKQNEDSQWHPLAKQWNVEGIPTMFLIDRNGVLRSVTARAEMEELIPKLLEEKAGSATSEPASMPATAPATEPKK